MKNIEAFIAIIFTTINSFGQNVQVFDRASVSTIHTVTAFESIDTAFDLSTKQKIATLKGFSLNSGKETLLMLFNSFWKNANYVGANSFSFDSLYHSKDTTFITVSIYYLDESDMEINFNLYPKNMVYVLGDIDKWQTSKTIRFNKNTIELLPMEYISYQNKIGGEAKVSIGGVLGGKVWIAGKEGRLPQHISVNGFCVGPTISLYTIGISFNTGSVYPVELGFGQFLMRILKGKKCC